MSPFIDLLVAIDVWLFHAINHGWSNAVFDVVFATVTNVAYWRPIYAVGIIILVWRGGNRGRWCAGTLLVIAAVVDPLSSAFLKETIHRLRPYEVLGSVHQLVGSGGGSFPSNHALNNMAGAMVLSAYFPGLRWLWFAVATVICISRVYCGVHWPSDVVGGSIIGVLVGGGLVMLTQRWKGVPAPAQP